MPHRCAFGCKDTGNVMHSFPNPDKFPERFKAWVNLVGNNMETLTDFDIYKKKRICDIHFTDVHRNRFKRLNALAVPTLYLPGERHCFSATAGQSETSLSFSHPTTSTSLPSTSTPGRKKDEILSNTMEFNLGFIGGGNMSTAIVKGILKSGVHTASKIWVAGPHIEHLIHWSVMGANVTSENGVVFDNCDMIFLGVKVNKLQDAIQGIKLTAKSTEKEVLFVSMLAGIQIEELLKTIKSHLTGVNASVIRIMPNTPMTVGAGICLYTPDSTVTQNKCLILEKLVSNSALCEKVPEDLMDSLGALIACGPAYMYVIIEALADGAVKQGVPRAMAMRHAAQMVVGSGQMVLQSGKHPALLKDEVCSPGGSTISGITALENGKLRATLINAVEASTIRNKELGKK